MKENKMDYRYMIEIAKINLIEKLNEKMREYKEEPNIQTKKEILELMKDRRQLFLFDTVIIEKYI